MKSVIHTESHSRCAIRGLDRADLFLLFVLGAAVTVTWSLSG